MGERKHCGEDQAKSQALPKATGKLLPFQFRERLYELTGAELSIWLAYFLHSDPEGIAWPSRDLLQEETWRNEDVITQVRARLVARGWLIRTGNKQPRKRGNRFAAPAYKVVIPPRSDVRPEREKRAHHGTFPPRSDVRPPHRSDVKSALRSDVTSERSTTLKNLQRTNTGAPSGARSPTVLGFGASPSGSPENKEKEKPSLEEGNGFSFNGRCLKVTPEQEQQIAEFLPLKFERNSQLMALDESLREAPADAVVAVEAWIKSEKAMQLKDYLRSRGWIK